MSADVLLFICKTLLFYYMVYFISIFNFLQGVFACFLIIRKIAAFTADACLQSNLDNA